MLPLQWQWTEPLYCHESQLTTHELTDLQIIYGEKVSNDVETVELKRSDFWSSTLYRNLKPHGIDENRRDDSAGYRKKGDYFIERSARCYGLVGWRWMPQ